MRYIASKQKILNIGALMDQPQFSSAVGGYSRREVDSYLSQLITRIAELETYNAGAIREQQVLREKVEELQTQLKGAQSPGYAKLGQQFEETLRLAETEASKLVQDATKEALRLREEARAEADRQLYDADQFANQVLVKAEREAKSLTRKAEKESKNLTYESEELKKQAEDELAKAQQKSSLMLNEAENQIARKRADAQQEFEKLSTQRAQLESVLANLEAEIQNRREESEREFAERSDAARAEVEKIYADAEERLQSATDEATSLLEKAETTYNEAIDKADQTTRDSESMSAALIQDARYRAEQLAIKSLEVTKNAIVDAENRLARLPGQKAEMEKFLDETRNLLTPQQESILRRKQIQENALKSIEGDILPPEDN